MKKKPSLLICGSLAYDELFSYHGHIKDHLPDRKSASLYVNIRARGPEVRRGGCGGNLAWTAALFSVPAAVFSWVGGDGGEYIQFLKDLGINTSQILTEPERSTPRAVLLSDKGEDQFLLFSSHEIPSGWKPVTTENSSFGVITAGVPQKTAETAAVFKKDKIPYAIDPGKFILDIEPEKLLFCITGADSLVVNSYEKQLLIKRTGKTWHELCSLVNSTIVTAGEEGSRVETFSEKTEVPAVVVKPPSLPGPSDPYGAGDAFLSGYSVGRLLGYSPVWSARIGTTAASFSLEKVGAQEHLFTWDSFNNRFNKAFGIPDIPLSEAYSLAGLPGRSFS